jgi:hypothetical protein
MNFGQVTKILEKKYFGQVTKTFGKKKRFFCVHFQEQFYSED